MAAPPHRVRNLLVVGLVAGALAVGAVALALALRRAPTVDAPPVPGVAGWRRLADAPLALTEVAAAPFDGRIWVAGGLDAGGSAVGAVLVYDPGSDTWSNGPDLAEPVHHAALIADSDALYLIGGYTGITFDRPTDAVWRLDRGSTAWTPDPPLPEPRGAGAGASDGGGRIVFAGGVGPDGVSADVFVGEGGSWQALGALAVTREHLGAASDGAGTVYVLGGRNGITGNLGNVDVATADGVRSLGDRLTPRGGVAGFFHPSVGACLVGGEEPAGTRSEVECVGPDGEVVALPRLGVARHGLGAVVLDGVAYVVLGGPEPGLHVSPVVEALDLPA
jgi:hypothetical protein